jgi:predicted DNA-binding transcriptional regulator YafY
MSKQSEWPLRWDALLRFRLIEIIALWEGRLTTNALMNAFGIGRQQASKDINAYLALAPENLVYDKTLKGYKPTSTFKPYYTKGEASEYLQLISSKDDLSSCFTKLNLEQANTSVLYSPIRTLKPEVIRPIVQAAREGKRIEVDYVSMNASSTEARVIAPHTLVWTGFRWHVRAFCEKNSEFRDFTLSRIFDVPSITLNSDLGIIDDVAWQAKVDIVVRPDSRLNALQKKVIAKEYGMTRNRLKISTRGALVHYMLQLLKIDPNIAQATGKAQQIIVENLDELKKWTF